ncbi:probable blue pigment (indigoidine) exporter [Saccharopolyspora kobensis]|uniref:Probable blue pigment (Indigoidine) exporter n=1 Tax=Saccharopolyspora kobensis TaxID=146035 RepID=A0A1H6C8K9_9PSEU|nr:EamA family transporter [Saccharopolyspora kobensis]SEG69319.1 probable blue pigment (indigoidine) exporter [Saccharopolyspora kobensis]SFC32296.1 probable blue pigment (indigoidine) exporter [Saccharopolyspora kobensis]
MATSTTSALAVPLRAPAPLRDVALTALAPACFGTVYAATALLLPPDRPLLAGAMRALPAGLLILALTRTLPRGKWWPKAIALALLNVGAFFPLLFLAAYRLPGGFAAALGALQPLVVAALAALLLKTRTPGRILLAFAVAAMGVGLMTITAVTAPDPVGVAAMLAATSIMGLGIVLGKKWGSPVPPLTMTGWQLTIGGLVLWPLTLVAEGLPATISAQNAAGFVYIGLVGTALAYTLWFRGVQRLAPTAVSQLSTVNPLVATAVGFVLLGQALTPWQIAGFTIALLALVAGQSMNRSTK